MRPSPALAAVCALGIVAGPSCQKSPTVPSAGSTPPVQTTEIVLTANTATPRNVEVPVGARVRFFNNDSRSHNMTSDPHPEHDSCPDINQAGFLRPGESRETGNLVVARTCGFHDHDNPDIAALHGQLVIK